MTIPPAPTEVVKRIPISINRLLPAIDQSGKQIMVDDKTKLQGGGLNLPKDTPEESFVSILFDSTTGEREMIQYRVAKNSGERVVLDNKNIPQIVGIIINEKIPAKDNVKRDVSAISMGDELNFANIGANVFCASLHLPLSKGMAGGEVVVITPNMLSNYKRSLGFKIA